MNIKLKLIAMRFCFILFVLVMHASLYSQSASDTGEYHKNPKNISIFIAAGPNYYFNNLVTFSDYVEPFNYSLYAKAQWNSKYRLSFGIEMEYIQLYHIRDIDTAANAKIQMRAIPIHLLMNMKLYKELYIAATFGPTFIQSHIESDRGSRNTSTLSLADVSIALGYRKWFKNNLGLGAQLKLYYSSKAEDMNIALPIELGYRF